MNVIQRYIACVAVALGHLICPCSSDAQQYTGTSGLIHTPSAEMNPGGTALIGAHIINRGSLPGNWPLYGGDTYNTFDYYLGIAFFDWVELSYTCTEMKTSGDGHWGGYGAKDRYFSVKFRPLKEGRWWPAVAIGMNDIYTGGHSDAVEEGAQYYFGNAYLSMTKNFHIGNQTFGVTVSYRHYMQGANSKWNGLVGGIFWHPSFAPQMRVIAEYSGSGINMGVDAFLWKFLLLQVSVYDFKYINGGVCFQIDLHPGISEKNKAKMSN